MLRRAIAARSRIRSVDSRWASTWALTREICHGARPPCTNAAGACAGRISSRRSADARAMQARAASRSRSITSSASSRSLITVAASLPRPTRCWTPLFAVSASATCCCAMMLAYPAGEGEIWSKAEVRDIERSLLSFDRRGPTLPRARNLSGAESRVELSGVKMYEALLRLISGVLSICYALAAGDAGTAAKTWRAGISPSLLPVGSAAPTVGSGNPGDECHKTVASANALEVREARCPRSSSHGHVARLGATLRARRVELLDGSAGCPVVRRARRAK